ncbi:MAG: hypothetical protein AABW71_03805 [Nanoarchaeota archaeon]|mgnify:CR=1 FL=1
MNIRTRNKYNKFFAGIAIGTAFLFGLNKISSTCKMQNLSGVVIEADGAIDGKVLHGPIYSDMTVPANMCSRYVRFAANDLFGIQYPNANAWDIRDASNVSEIPVNSKEDVIKLAKDRFMKRGMALGLYNPKSKYNNVAQNDGAGYTHVALYLGMDRDGRMYFADKFGKETRKRTSLDELLEKGNLQPRELLFLNNQ